MSDKPVGRNATRADGNDTFAPPGAPSGPADDDQRPYAGPVPLADATWRRRFRSHEWGTILFFAAVFIYFASVKGSVFFSASNIYTTLAQNAYLVFIAVGVTFPLIAGQLDLSVGAVAGLSAVLTAGLTSQQHYPVWLAIACVIVVGAVTGLVNGLLVTVVKVNVFIATLGTAGVASGVALIYAKGNVIYSGIPVSLTNFGTSTLAGNFPAVVILPAAMTIVTWFLARRTIFGRHLFAVGSNPLSSRLAGVRVERTIVLSLTIAGILSALGGVVFTARFGSVDPNSGNGYLLPAFAAAFLGSSILSDGQFSVLGTAVATYLVAYAGSGLLDLGLQYSGEVFNGIVLIGAVALNELLRRRLRTRRRSGAGG